MSIENRINLEIDSVKRESIETGITGIKTELTPLLVALSAEKKRNLPIVGERLITFVEQAAQSANNNLNLVPPYLNLDNVKVDLDAWKFLNSISKELENLQSMLNDTAALSGSEAYVAMLSYYNYLHQATKDGVPGAKPLYDSLKHHFTTSKTSTSTNTKED